MGKFTIKERFYLNDEPFQIISGSIHYFRVVPEYWRDRLEKLRAMGCNTVETYVPWNLHEPKPGEYRFEGQLDLATFLQTAQELGLYVILRPSPYICAEWEFGGLPPWLLAGEDMPLRSSQGPFLSYVERYYSHLFARIVPLQIDYGGPVILMQVENEFGAWGQVDSAYMQALRDMMRRLGATVPFITSDNFEDNSLERGPVEGALATANFGSDAGEKLEILRPYTKDGPLMVTEFWTGWFDAWGDEKHHTAAAAPCAADLDAILKRGSVNFYMFHGGSNFGFMNGANDYGKLMPDTASYDYDAPLSEDGQITPKYHAFRNVIARYQDVPDMYFSTDIRRNSYGVLHCDGWRGLFEAIDTLSQRQILQEPRSMEQLGQSYGYILYSTLLPSQTDVTELELRKTADRAQVFLDRDPAVTLYDRQLLEAHPVNWRMRKAARMDILVENMGRVNYGRSMRRQRKGIDGEVLLNGEPVLGWEVWTLPLELEAVNRISFAAPEHSCQPAFYHFTLHVEEAGDTFLDLTGWGKGCAFLNGFALGRFWSIGPQRRLYIPAPLLKEGANELVIFETEGNSADTVRLLSEPDLG